MTAQQYLLSQAEFCRRTASQSADPYLAEELARLAQRFEMSALRSRSGLSPACAHNSAFDAAASPA